MAPVCAIELWLVNIKTTASNPPNLSNTGWNASVRDRE